MELKGQESRNDWASKGESHEEGAGPSDLFLGVWIVMEGRKFNLRNLGESGGSLTDDGETKKPRGLIKQLSGFGERGGGKT